MLKEMKTSNKLLIAFAAALIVLPILGMVYASQVWYTDSKKWADEAKKDDSFGETSSSMARKELSAFQSVNIASGNGMYFGIRLIKDTKFGVKIPNQFKDQIKFTVDAQGVLQVELTAKESHNNNYLTLLIYAPETKAISIAEAGGMNLNAKTDSLAISLKKSGELVFDSETSINKLSVVTEDVNALNIEKQVAKSLYLDLKHTNFTSEWASYQDLSIAAADNSNITIKGDEREGKKYSIQNLVLTTGDVARVEIEGITVGNCKGSLSDQTVVNMPAVNLKQLFSK